MYSLPGVIKSMVVWLIFYASFDSFCNWDVGEEMYFCLFGTFIFSNFPDVYFFWECFISDFDTDVLFDLAFGVTFQETTFHLFFSPSYVSFFLLIALEFVFEAVAYFFSLEDTPIDSTLEFLIIFFVDWGNSFMLSLLVSTLLSILSWFLIVNCFWPIFIGLLDTEFLVKFEVWFQVVYCSMMSFGLRIDLITLCTDLFPFPSKAHLSTPNFFELFHWGQLFEDDPQELILESTLTCLFFFSAFESSYLPTLTNRVSSSVFSLIGFKYFWFFVFGLGFHEDSLELHSEPALKSI